VDPEVKTLKSTIHETLAIVFLKWIYKTVLSLLSPLENRDLFGLERLLR